MKHFLHNLNVERDGLDPVLIHYDSIAALACAKDPKYHGKIKHIEVKYNFIKDMIAHKEMVPEHILTSQMIANLLTKPNTTKSFKAHVRELRLRRW